MLTTMETSGGARSTGFSRRCDLSAKNSVPIVSVRRIALHADDLGMNAAVTDGILRGFDEGLLTSTSLLSNAPDASRALDCWRQLELQRREGRLKSAGRRRRLDDPAQPFDLGVHLNLTQGRPMTGAHFPAELLDADGRFVGVFGLFRRLQHCQRPALERLDEELTSQVRFMLDRGHKPTHLNGHQYIELLPAVAPLVESLLERFGIPAVRVAWEPSWRRSIAWPGIRATQWLLGGAKKFYAGRFRRRISGRKTCAADGFFGTMTAGTTTAAMLRRFLAASRGCRLVEVGLHPGLETPASSSKRCDGWFDPLAASRPRELALIASCELEEHFAAEGCCLGRLAEL